MMHALVCLASSEMSNRPLMIARCHRSSCAVTWYQTLKDINLSGGQIMQLLLIYLSTLQKILANKWDILISD
jgi:hypothetical protein